MPFAWVRGGRAFPRDGIYLRRSPLPTSIHQPPSGPLLGLPNLWYRGCQFLPPTVGSVLLMPEYLGVVSLPEALLALRLERNFLSEAALLASALASAIRGSGSGGISPCLMSAARTRRISGLDIDLGMLQNRVCSIQLLGFVALGVGC